MFRFSGCEKVFLCDAVFFPVHQSEQRYAAHCNHRPRRRLWDGRDGESVGEGPLGQPRDQGGVNLKEVRYATDQISLDRGNLLKAFDAGKLEFFWVLCNFRGRLIGLPKCSRLGLRVIALRYARSRSKPA
jgi:hypothetical protein